MALQSSRRAFVKGAAGILATPYLSRNAFAQDAIKLRCSLDTAPSHPRNQAITDYLEKLEAASNGATAPNQKRAFRLVSERAQVQFPDQPAFASGWKTPKVFPSVSRK